MKPPEEGLKTVGQIALDTRSRERLADRASDERVGVRSLASARDVEGFSQQRKQHQAGDEHQDDGGLDLLGEVVAQPARLDAPSPDGGPHEHYEEDQGEDIQVGGENPDAGAGQDRLRELVP